MIDLNKDCHDSRFWESDMRVCKKCGQEKELEQFCDMVNLGKSHDCKICRNKYTASYYLTNKEQIRANEKLRKLRAKEKLKK